MKNLLSLILVMLSLVVEAQLPIDASQLETRNELKFLKGSTVPFTGKVITWLSPGHPQIEANYKDGFLDGMETTRDKQGRLFSEIMFVRGKFNGKVRQYFENGQLEFEKIYSNDYMNGLSTHWHANGNKESEGNYMNCRETGTWAFWYKNGRKAKEGNFREGFEEGEWTFWDERGSQLESQTFHDGVLVPEKP